MPNHGNEPVKANSSHKTEDLVELLRAGMFEEFRELFKVTVNGTPGGIFALAEAVNQRLQVLNPGCKSKILVSQKNGTEKHIVMIMDSSRMFGDSFTVTRQMFVV